MALESRVDHKEQSADQSNAQLMVRVLQEIPVRDREALAFFYLRGESPVEICSRLGLSGREFWQIRRRAMARFQELKRAQRECNELRAMKSEMAWCQPA